ncbi:MAG TPA: ABC transporter substrate-binding protein [Candidatus Binatia bacterium]|jgi:NitT/TauT family transport system substrate-binding protein
MRKNILTISAVGVAALAALLSSAHPIGAQELRKVHVAIPGVSPGAASPFVLARDLGYYREEGLQVELVVMPAAISAQALVAGNVEFISAGGSSLPPALRGAPIRFYFTAFYRPMYWLFSRPDIQGIKELKGKKLGVSSIGSGPDSLLRQVLKNNGIDGGRDATIMALGASTARFYALQAGSVDASMLGIPANLLAEDAGFRQLLSFIHQEFLEFQGNIVAREQLEQSDPSLLERFARATLKGFLSYRDNRAAAVKLLSRFMKIAEPQMARTYDAILPSLTRDGTVSEDLQRKSIEHILDRVGLKEAPPMERIYRYGLVKKINAELQKKGWRAAR